MLPPFRQARDCVRLLAVGRERFIDILNRSKTRNRGLLGLGSAPNRATNISKMLPAVPERVGRQAQAQALTYTVCPH